MKCKFLNKNIQNNSVIVFFNGWGMDSNMLSHLDFAGFDVIECNSYHTNGLFLFDELERYEKKYLFAYSMGVWAAAKTFDSYSALFNLKIAIAGSIFPVDDLNGIPVSIFTATLQNLSPVTLEKFNLRMCGSEEILKFYKKVKLDRDFDDCKSELQFIYNHSLTKMNNFNFDTAIISKNDKIFSVNNLKYSFSDTKQIFLDAPHFPFYLWKSWNDLLNFEVLVENE